MKKIFFLIAIVTGMLTQKIAAQDSTKNQLTVLLNNYYSVKNALVNSDATVAGAKANELLKAINSVDMNSLTESVQMVFMSLKEKLAFDARHISESKDIEHQREHFANLSSNMLALAKKAKLSTQPIYQVYCPMKKSYWLSNETEIKNPYYGKAMPTCGKVSQTLK